MKYCLPDTCSPIYLNQADEIEITSINHLSDKILNLMEFYPNCEHIIFPHSNYSDTEMRRYIALTKGKAIFAFSTWPIGQIDDDIPWLCYEPICSFIDLKDLLERYHPVYIYIGADLMHHLDAVINYGVPIRYNDYTPDSPLYNLRIEQDTSILGNFIRPEDIETYSKYISVMEFGGTPKRQEGMFRIYKSGNWSGKLKTLFPQIKTEAVNRLIPPDFAERRINCRLGCAKGGKCRYCYSVLNYFAIEGNIRKLKELVDENEST